MMWTPLGSLWAQAPGRARGVCGLLRFIWFCVLFTLFCFIFILFYFGLVLLYFSSVSFLVCFILLGSVLFSSFCCIFLVLFYFGLGYLSLSRSLIDSFLHLDYKIRLLHFYIFNTHSQSASTL